MLSGAAVLTSDRVDHYPHGGRYVEAPTTVNRRVPVRLGDHRTAERFVSLTTTRLHATTVYVVAEVDGTGRLTDPRLTVTPDLARARRVANAAVARWGGVANTEEN